MGCLQTCLSLLFYRGGGVSIPSEMHFHYSSCFKSSNNTWFLASFVLRIISLEFGCATVYHSKQFESTKPQIFKFPQILWNLSDFLKPHGVLLIRCWYERNVTYAYALVLHFFCLNLWSCDGNIFIDMNFPMYWLAGLHWDSSPLVDMNTGSFQDKDCLICMGIFFWKIATVQFFHYSSMD